MNGSLHVGHGFTISKVEFATCYARMKGKRAPFPLGFHCTGMAIKACADKLVREIEDFGLNFERCQEDEGEEEAAAAVVGDLEQQTGAGDVTEFRSKKSKTLAKSVKSRYQFQIMLAQGIPREEIHRFADPYHWVHVFPEAGMQEVSCFGLRIDWRRSAGGCRRLLCSCHPTARDHVRPDLLLRRQEHCLRHFPRVGQGVLFHLEPGRTKHGFPRHLSRMGFVYQNP